MPEGLAAQRSTTALSSIGRVNYYRFLGLTRGCSVVELRLALPSGFAWIKDLLEVSSAGPIPVAVANPPFGAG